MNPQAQDVFAHVPYGHFRARLDEILSRRLQPEIYFSSKDIHELDAAEARRLAGRLHESGLSCTCHAPFFDLNPGAVDEDIRALSVFKYKALIRAAAVFRPRTIVFHPGYDKWRYDNRPDRWLEQSLRSWPDILAAAEANLPDSLILIENIFETEPSSLARLLTGLDHANIGFCFDAGHFFLFHEVPLDEWLRLLGPYMVEVHLHDNGGDRDAHLPPGRGGFPFGRLFDFVQSAPRRIMFTIESHNAEDLQSSMAYLGERFGFRDPPFTLDVVNRT